MKKSKCRTFISTKIHEEGFRTFAWKCEILVYIIFLETVYSDVDFFAFHGPYSYT